MSTFEIYINGIIQCVLFCEWLILLNMVWNSFVIFVLIVVHSFYRYVELLSMSSPTYSSIYDAYSFGLFLVWENFGENIVMHVFSWTYLCICVWYILGMELWDHREPVCFMFGAIVLSYPGFHFLWFCSWSTTVWKY